jgi:hypothetical protein
VRRHLGIGSVDLRLVQAGLDHGDLGVVGNNETWHAADGGKGACVGTDPIAERLRPRRLDIGEARRAHHRHEDLRLAYLAGQPVDDHRHCVAGVIDEQLVAAHVGLAHRDRELAFPEPIQLAEARVAVALGIVRDVLVPQDRQRDVLALELAMDHRPVRLGLPPVALLAAGIGEQPRLERGVSQLLGQRPAEAGSLEASDRGAGCRCRHSNATGNLTGRYATNELQPKHFAHVAHGRSLCWHPVSPSKVEGADLSRPAEAPDPRAKSSRNGGRHHLGTVGEIISESVGGIIPERRAASAGIGTSRYAIPPLEQYGPGFRYIGSEIRFRPPTG